jgi:hypothetical protein
MMRVNLDGPRRRTIYLLLGVFLLLSACRQQDVPAAEPEPTSAPATLRRAEPVTPESGPFTGVTEPTDDTMPETEPASATAVTVPDVPEAATPEPPPSPPPPSFSEQFHGSPQGPMPWNPAHWDVTVHSRDRETWYELESMHAGHGSECEAPPDSHLISSYEQTVYLCNDHIMTAINATGYGMIYLTPNHLVDFSQHEAVIRFDLSTERTSARDWVDVWITPYEDNLQLALDDWLPDLQGEPRRAVHIVMDFLENTVFRAEIFRDFEIEEVEMTPQGWQGYEAFLEPSATRRDTFELRLSRNHIKFGMPDYDFWWIDTEIAPLDWSQGVVQFGHHSYNPLKDCPFEECSPSTWHWDNVFIQPAVPFTIIPANRRYVDTTVTTRVRLAGAAPVHAHLRFAGIGNDLEVSFDRGYSWEPAQLQKQQTREYGDELFRSYWTLIPHGVTTVDFRGSDWWGGRWHVRDISVWAPPSSVTGSTVDHR